MLPLFVPPVATGLVLLMLFGRRGPLGSVLQRGLGMEIVFTWRAVVLACAVMSFPLLVRTAQIAFQEVNRASKISRERSAQANGASSRRSACRLPRAASSLEQSSPSRGPWVNSALPRRRRHDSAQDDDDFARDLSKHPAWPGRRGIASLVRFDRHRLHHRLLRADDLEAQTPPMSLRLHKSGFRWPASLWRSMQLSIVRSPAFSGHPAREKLRCSI